MQDLRYFSFNDYLRKKFGCRVARIPLNLGLGCPNRDGLISFGGCIFCDYTGSGVADSSLSLEEQLRLGIERAKRRYKAKLFLAYFQAFSNTYAPVNKLKEFYDRILAFPEIVGIIIGTRPDLVNREILDLIASYKRHLAEVWVEYGLQSAHYKTLRLINRGHGPSDFLYAVKITKEKDLKVGCHVIIGLPGEDREDMIETARFVSACGVNGVKIHLLHVLKDTPLEKLYKEGKIRLLELEEYVDLVVDFLEHLSPDIVIQRLTGEAPKERLVAPLWCLNKTEVINRIRERLKERNTFQGRALFFYKSF